jgi:hypothetical protein
MIDEFVHCYHTYDHWYAVTCPCGGMDDTSSTFCHPERNAVKSKDLLFFIRTNLS